jgi:cholesterol oxidase
LLYGYKLIRDDEGFDVWADTTTLFVTVHDGDDERAPVSGRAVLRIHAKDFAKQLRTMRVTNAGSLLRRITAAAEFGRFFAGALYDTYGGVLAKRSVLDPDAPPRALRELRTDPPETHFFKTADGVSLRMLRFPGEGAEGGVPVLLVHGLGMSGRIFHADTVETNLVEYLHEAGLDVWVVELRASPESGHDTPEFTLDDLARHDLPAAVAHVREVSGAAAIDVVAQGIGAMALQMSLVDGLAGVRSAVCMQAGLHLATPRLSRLKAGLHVPAVLKAFGKQTLSARSGGNGWVSSLFDATLRMLPVELAETCSNPVCRRITFMYGPLYEHEQVNRATHDAMHELFGVTHLTAFEHLTRMVRAGEAVSTGGATYVRDLDRLAIPITFLHGAENAGILPESTQETFDLLRARNGDALYRRHVIRGYGDVDCVIGRDAVRDVFPYILEHLRMDRRGKPKAATANRTYR